jgi:hypothetical protein
MSVAAKAFLISTSDLLTSVGASPVHGDLISLEFD